MGNRDRRLARVGSRASSCQRCIVWQGSTEKSQWQSVDLVEMGSRGGRKMKGYARFFWGRRGGRGVEKSQALGTEWD